MKPRSIAAKTSFLAMLSVSAWLMAQIARGGIGADGVGFDRSKT